VVGTSLCPAHTPPMDREALHGAQANGWLTTLCSQLRSCQTTDDVADVVGALDQGALFGGQIEDVLDQLRTATTYAHLQELLLAGKYRLSFSFLSRTLRSHQLSIMAASSWSPHLSKWLIKSFPASAEEFLSSSHGEIIERVSLFLQVLNCPLDRRTQGFLTAARKRSELSQPVLKALLGLDTDRRDGDDMSPLSPKKNASTFQKGKARDRKGTQYTRDNNKTDLEHNLETLGFSVPTSEEGNRMTIATLLAVLKEDLQVCSITTLRIWTHHFCVNFRASFGSCRIPMSGLQCSRSSFVKLKLLREGRLRLLPFTQLKRIAPVRAIHCNHSRVFFLLKRTPR